MNLEDYTDFKLPKNAYLSFDATTLKDLIIERLNESEAFTDQNFEGSNFNAFIDVVAYMYHVLLFYLNTTSNESTFTTATIYENMNKLVSNIGYKPIGDQTSLLNISLAAENIDSGVYTIPRFSFINANGSGFYTLQDITFQKTQDTVLEDLFVNNNTLYQGQLKEVGFTASGEKYETFTLIDRFKSEQANEAINTITETKFISDNAFTIFVKNSVTGEWTEWCETGSLFLEGPTSTCYEKRLNPKGDYEFKFGDGNNGQALREGDRVIVFYVISDNVSGIIGSGASQSQKFNLYTSSNFNSIRQYIYNEVNVLSPAQLNNIVINNSYESTPIKTAETVDEIRANAPRIFTSQDRLVSKGDYEAHINRNFGNIVKPVKILSNEDYTSQVLQYFSDIGTNSSLDDARSLLAQVNFSSSTNFNNIYVYTVRSNEFILGERIPNYLSEGQKRLITEYCNKKKDVTHNVVISDPVFKAFSFGVGEVTSNNTVDDIVRDSLIRLTVNRNVAVSDASLRDRVSIIFKDAFNQIELGDIINVAQLSRDILNIDGVESIETINGNNKTTSLSFVVWNPDYKFIDNDVIANEYKLRDFQLAYFYNVSDIVNKIDIRRV